MVFRAVDTKFLALGRGTGPSEGVVVRVFGRESASVTRRLGDLCASQGGP